MNVKSFDVVNLLKPDVLVCDYLNQEKKLTPFFNGSVSELELIHDAGSMNFSLSKRNVLVDVLHQQYRKITVHQSVNANIDSFLGNKTFTVSTGHQLCLLTGPLYFIYKIASTIKLAQILSETNRELHFVPVFWMATEDHDFEEVNHAFLYDEKIEWQTQRKGAVGELSLESLSSTLQSLETILKIDSDKNDILNIIHNAYKLENLADATRYLVNALFGQYGLVIVDANHRSLKAEFIDILKSELLLCTSFNAVTETNEKLSQLGYKPTVNPRAINLFYLNEGMRERIVKSEDDSWSVLNTDIRWNQTELIALLQDHPEKFSPNVLLRPLYQECILPNLAYIGGPGELAYWLQLKSTFDAHNVKFPKLLLRDSAILLSEKASSLLMKLNLSFDELFEDEHTIQKRIVGGDDVSLAEEKSNLELLMSVVAEKVKTVDSTLETSVGADARKIIGMLEHLEKKMIRALKTKEEVKLKQLEKLLIEIFPEGVLQERHDNLFQYSTQFDGDLIGELISQFNPLKNELHVFELPVRKS